MYQLTEAEDVVVRVEDGAVIPRGHRWWSEYERWLADGNTPEPAIDTGPTLEKRVDQAIERLLDETVQGRRYAGIVSCVSYVNDPNPTFAAEAKAAVEWRSAIYTKCYELLAAPPGGVTTVEQVLALMPKPQAYGWPED